MAKYILSIFFSLLLIGFVSCDEEKGTNKGQGYLYLDVEKNVTMQTKAVDPVLAVAILNAAKDTIKYIADFEVEKVDEGILLDAGAYDIVVSSGRKDSAAFELPYYYGEAACEIKTNQVTSTKITCKIANTKVTVDYSDDFKKYFTDYSTTISNSSGSLTFEKGETRGGFFAPEKLLANLALTNKDGERFQLKREYEDIQERYHYRLFFKLSGDPNNPDDSGEAGGKFDDITVDESADTVIVSIPIKVEDLENVKSPDFKLEGFGEENKIEAKVGKFRENILKVVAPCGMEKLSVIVLSDSLNTRLELQTFDLVNPESGVREKLESIHFPVLPDIKGATDTLTFDLTAMSNALVPYDQSVQPHTFIITAQDAKSQEKSITFSYSVKPDVAVITNEIATMNIWSTFTFFSGESEGNGDFGFEYKKVSGADDSWESVESKNVEGKAFSAFVTGLEPKTEYVYRAFNKEQEGNPVYGNEVRFKTDYANADDYGNPFVPNLGFEDWHTDGLQYPYKKGDVPFGATGNTDMFLKFNFTTGVSGEVGNAAQLKSQIVMKMKLAAGNLFIGTFELDGMDGVLTLGQACKLRPTSLSGRYNYTPKSITTEYATSDLPAYVQNGVPDSCSIYIALTTSKVTVATKTRVLFDKNDKSIIAYGELPSDKVSATNGYQDFTIPLVYRKGKETEVPAYIIIVSSASKFGDYFVGGDGSVLLLDEFKLGFDYNPASFVGTSLEGLGK
ncbi:MAG: DUF4493 domain-containing protein [Parabacteroides sp.]|nr:DUF4493 domain-containing protein [Parabacteroides sp.]